MDTTRTKQGLMIQVRCSPETYARYQRLLGEYKGHNRGSTHDDFLSHLLDLAEPHAHPAL